MKKQELKKTFGNPDVNGYYPIHKTENVVLGYNPSKIRKPFSLEVDGSRNFPKDLDSIIKLSNLNREDVKADILWATSEPVKPKKLSLLKKIESAKQISKKINLNHNKQLPSKSADLEK